MKVHLPSLDQFIKNTGSSWHDCRCVYDRGFDLVLVRVHNKGREESVERTPYGCAITLQNDFCSFYNITACTIVSLLSRTLHVYSLQWSLFHTLDHAHKMLDRSFLVFRYFSVGSMQSVCCPELRSVHSWEVTYTLVL